MTGWSVAGAVVVAIAITVFTVAFFNAWRRYRGLRVITCPDNLHSAAVHLDVLRAARWSAVSGEAPLNIRTCSRWPEKAGCDQACVPQIESLGDASRVQTIAAAWYAGKRCCYCRKPIEDIIWHERPPALLTPEGMSREWKEVAAEELPEIFKTHQPVCWTCHIRESFRREHGDLVIERIHQVEPHQVIAPTASVY